MNLKKLISKRHSVRNYKKSYSSILGITVDKLYLYDVIREASKAPSAGELKAYKVFIVIKKGIKKLAKIAQQKWISKAFLIFVICIDPEKSAKKYGERGRNLYCIQDATLFGAYLDLLLVEKGYGTCWVGAFDPEEIKKFLKIPKHLIPISLLVVGKEDKC